MQPDDEPWGEPCLTAVTTVEAPGPGLTFLNPVPHSPTANFNLAAAHAELKRLFALHDFTASLNLAQNILQATPNDAQVQAIVHQCREQLSAMFKSKIGALQRVPHVLLAADELPWLDLDPRAGFVLSLVDGVLTYEEIVDVMGVDTLETLRICALLVTNKVIGTV